MSHVLLSGVSSQSQKVPKINCSPDAGAKAYLSDVICPTKSTSFNENTMDFCFLGDCPQALFLCSFFSLSSRRQVQGLMPRENVFFFFCVVAVEAATEAEQGQYGQHIRLNNNRFSG